MNLLIQDSQEIPQSSLSDTFPWGCPERFKFPPEALQEGSLGVSPRALRNVTAAPELLKRFLCKFLVEFLQALL